MQFGHTFSTDNQYETAKTQQFGTYRLNAVIMLTALFITFFLTACSGSKSAAKNPASNTDSVTATQKKDSPSTAVTVELSVAFGAGYVGLPSDNKITVAKGSNWAGVKTSVIKALTFEPGYEASAWMLVSGQEAKPLEDSYTFNGGKTGTEAVRFSVYKTPLSPPPAPAAGSKTVKLSFGCTPNSGAVTPGYETLTVEKGTAWKDIKSYAESICTPKLYREIEKWQAGAADISDTYRFTENCSLTAVLKDNRVFLQFFIHPSGSNTEHLKIGIDQLAVKNGSAWGKVKDKVLTNIKPIEGYENYGFDKISLGSADGKVITDDFIFKTGDAQQYKLYIHEKKTKHILTIEYDNGIADADPEVIYADINARWGSVKNTATKALTFKEGYGLKEWRHGFSTTVLTDDYKITDNHPIRAVSKSAIVTVKIEENPAFYTVAKPKEVVIPVESRWSAVEAQVQKLINLKDSSVYGIYGWQYTGGKEPKSLAGSYRITDETFTVRPIIRPKYVNISLKADTHIDIGSPALLKSVPNGTRWKDIKAQADAKLTIHEHYGLKEWRISDAKGDALPDDYEFIQNTDIYAKTKGVSPYIKGNVYCFGDNDFEMKNIPAVKNGTIGSVGEIYNRVHEVNLSAYQISAVEVTEGWYNLLMKNNREAEGKLPKTGMTWYEAVVFCNELTKMFPSLGESECIYTYNKEIYNSNHAAAQNPPVMNIKKKGFRLPTGAEWEWAAQGGSARTVWAGTSEPNKLTDYAWYDVNSSGRIHRTAETLPNALGLYDMSGNAGEWCWNWDDNSLIDGATDPVGPYSGEKRVYRGGTYEYNSDSCKCSFTYIRAPHSESYNIGFRIVRRP